MLNESVLVNWSSFILFLNFKGTPSQEEHKIIFSFLTICKIALSDQSDFPAIFRLRKMASRNFINSGT